MRRGRHADIGSGPCKGREVPVRCGSSGLIRFVVLLVGHGMYWIAALNRHFTLPLVLRGGPWPLA